MSENRTVLFFVVVLAVVVQGMCIAFLATRVRSLEAKAAGSESKEVGRE
jgi:NhaP-type Na+/H+ and K+/H+ antiporter